MLHTKKKKPSKITTIIVFFKYSKEIPLPDIQVLPNVSLEFSGSPAV